MADEIPQTLDSKRVFEGRVFRVRVDELRYADGATHRCDVVEHEGTFGIIPLLRSGEIVLVRQYRHPVGRVLWEIPAGTSEAGEPAAEGALRELAEETGFRAGSIRPLWSVYMTPGFCDEAMHFFVAEDLREGSQSLDEDERIEVGRFTLARAFDLFERGEIADVKTLLALQWLAAQRGELTTGTVDRKN